MVTTSRKGPDFDGTWIVRRTNASVAGSAGNSGSETIPAAELVRDTIRNDLFFDPLTYKSLWTTPPAFWTPTERLEGPTVIGLS